MMSEYIQMLAIATVSLLPIKGFRTQVEEKLRRYRNNSLDIRIQPQTFKCCEALHLLTISYEDKFSLKSIILGKEY